MLGNFFYCKWLFIDKVDGLVGNDTIFLLPEYKDAIHLKFYI